VRLNTQSYGKASGDVPEALEMSCVSNQYRCNYDYEIYKTPKENITKQRLKDLQNTEKPIISSYE
jgi:hypothetical protein